MPSDTLIFLLKVFGFSALISAAIRYGGPFLPLPATDSPATNGIALAIVLSLPVGVLGLLLWQRYTAK